MEVLEAGIEDIPELCDLLNYLFEQEAEFKPSRSLQINGLRQIINNNKSGIIFVLKKDEKIIGMVSLLFTVSTALGGIVVLLEDMVVTPSQRGNGYGSQLLRSAIDYANRKGCKRITLLTDNTNKRAQKFYASHGFTLSGMSPMRYLFESDNA